MQLRQMGAPADVLAATEQRLRDEAGTAGCRVWPENWHAVRAFVAMATQWHWVPSGMGAQRAGLRYEALAAVLPAVRHSVPEPQRQAYHALMTQLQILEACALDELATVAAQQS